MKSLFHVPYDRDLMGEFDAVKMIALHHAGRYMPRINKTRDLPAIPAGWVFLSEADAKEFKGRFGR